MFEYYTSEDYQKYPRTRLTTTIREDLYEEFQIFCIKQKTYQTKSLDMIIELVLHDEKLKNELINKICTYH